MALATPFCVLKCGLSPGMPPSSLKRSSLPNVLADAHPLLAAALLSNEETGVRRLRNSLRHAQACDPVFDVRDASGLRARATKLNRQLGPGRLVARRGGSAGTQHVRAGCVTGA